MLTLSPGAVLFVAHQIELVPKCSMPIYHGDSIMRYDFETAGRERSAETRDPAMEHKKWWLEQWPSGYDKMRGGDLGGAYS